MKNPVIQTVALAIVLALSAGCATTHIGRYAEPETNNEKIPLLISGQIDRDVNTPGSTLINLTFENKGNRWVKVEAVDVVVDPEYSDKISVVVGKDLEDWMTAYNEKKKLERANNGWLWAGLLASGYLTAVTLKDAQNGWRALNAAGAVAATVGGAALIVNAVRGEKDEIGKPARDKNAALEPMFSVPSGLFVKKWLLLNTPANQRLAKLVLRLKTIEGETETYDISFI